ALHSIESTVQSRCTSVRSAFIYLQCQRCGGILLHVSSPARFILIVARWCAHSSKRTRLQIPLAGQFLLHAHPLAVCVCCYCPVAQMYIVPADRRNCFACNRIVSSSVRPFTSAATRACVV